MCVWHCLAGYIWLQENGEPVTGYMQVVNEWELYVAPWP